MNMFQTSIQEALECALSQYAAMDLIAFEEDSRSYSYKDVHSMAASYAQECLVRGWTGGVRVGLQVEKTAKNVSLFLGLILAGACPAFIDPRMKSEMLDWHIRGGGLEALIVDVIEHGITNDRRENTVAVAEIEAGSSPATATLPTMASADAALLLFTSGSTGLPKGVLLSQLAVVSHGRAVAKRTKLQTSDRLLHAMPLFHTNGLNNQVLAPILAGSTVILQKRFDAELTVENMRLTSPSIVTGVPTMFLRMLKFVNDGDVFPSLRMLRCGSAPIKTTQAELIERSFGAPIILSYGMSEATCTSTINPPDSPKPGSVGTAVEGQQVLIRTSDACLTDEPGVEGEVVIGGDALMSGYVGSDQAHPIENGWLSTGDLGILDQDGYLTITGRLKDTIVRGGENLSPAMIEKVIVRHPGVKDCSVVPREHTDLGQVPVAFVTSFSDQTEELQKELKGLVELRLARHVRPVAIRIVDDLPINPVGKVDRKKLSVLDAALAETEE